MSYSQTEVERTNFTENERILEEFCTYVLFYSYVWTIYWLGVQQRMARSKAIITKSKRVIKTLSWASVRRLPSQQYKDIVLLYQRKHEVTWSQLPALLLLLFVIYLVNFLPPPPHARHFLTLMALCFRFNRFVRWGKWLLILWVSYSTYKGSCMSVPESRETMTTIRWNWEKFPCTKKRMIEKVGSPFFFLSGQKDEFFCTCTERKFSIKSY